MTKQARTRGPARWNFARTAAAMLAMATLLTGLVIAELRAQRTEVAHRAQGTVAASYPRIADTERPLRAETSSRDADPKARAARLLSLGYLPAASVHLPIPRGAPAPPARTEPPDPASTRPPMNNPGGVDGDRPHRAVPGVTEP